MDSKQISGTITYTLTIKDGVTEIDFNESIDNELASLIMSQYLIESAIAGLSVQKKESTGDKKKIAEDRLRSVMGSRQGLRTLVNLFLDSYDHMQNEVNRPKITVDVGQLNEEEMKRLIGDKDISKMK